MTDPANVQMRRTVHELARVDGLGGAVVHTIRAIEITRLPLLRRSRRNRFAGLYCEVRDFEQPVFGLCACASEAMANGTIKHVYVFLILDSFILWMSLT